MSFSRKSAVAGASLLAASCGLDPNGLLGETQTLDAAVPFDGSRFDAQTDARADAGDASAVVVDASDATTPPIDASGGIDASDGPPPLPPFCESSSTLLACFRFEGSVVDESSFGHQPSTLTGVSFVAGHEGQAVSVGTTSAIYLPTAPEWNTTQVSIEMWIKPSALPATGARMGLLDSDGRYGAFIYDDGVRCLVPNAVSAGLVSTGVWTHIACVNDGTTLSAYKNGALVASMAAGQALGQGNATTAIGSNSPSGDSFVGAIDSLRVWTVGRTAQQIAAAAQR